MRWAMKEGVPEAVSAVMVSVDWRSTRSMERAPRRGVEVGDRADGQTAVSECHREFLELVEGLAVVFAVLHHDIELAVLDLEVGDGP